MLHSLTSLILLAQWQHQAIIKLSTAAQQIPPSLAQSVHIELRTGLSTVQLMRGICLSTSPQIVYYKNVIAPMRYLKMFFIFITKTYVLGGESLQKKFFLLLFLHNHIPIIISLSSFIRYSRTLVKHCQDI